MKTVLTIFTFFCTLQVVFSQNCEDISPYKEGMQLEYTNYNKKGKERSKETYKIQSVTNEDGGLVIKIANTIADKGEEGVSGVQTLKCVNGNFYVEMAGYLAHQNENQQSTLQLKAEGDFVEFPEEIKTGLDLKDGNIDLKLGGGSSDIALASMQVNNRKVLEDTKISIPAGEFDGYKVSFDYTFNMGILKIRGSGIEWYVKGIGIVKSESYSKKGKLRWTRVLTKMK